MITDKITIKPNYFPILITGSEGLIGSHLRNKLKLLGFKVYGYDIREAVSVHETDDICNFNRLQSVISKVKGIIHLGAVSRVIWGEQYPKACWRVNVEGTKNVLKAACKSPHQPWVIYGSSREVYGEQRIFPVLETATFNPRNIYAESKIAAEKLVNAFKTELNTSILRFSNVYGWVYDYNDRVLPAFCCAAALGNPIYIEGGENTFDFTHVGDVVDGIIAVILRLIQQEQLPPIHLTAGIATSLLQAAQLANRTGGMKSRLIYRSPRGFDVSRFYGDTTRAKELLGWEPNILPEQGIPAFVNAFKHHKLKAKVTAHSFR